MIINLSYAINRLTNNENKLNINFSRFLESVICS